MKNQNISTIAIVAIVSLVVGFGGGIKYQSSKKTEFVNQFSGGNRNNFNQQRPQGAVRPSGSDQGGQMRGMNRPVAGEIISSDNKSVTVKQLDGSNKIVLISATTQINKAQTALITDLKVGEKVSIFGTSNPDGSVTAQNVQLNPITPNIGNIATPSGSKK